MTEQLHAGTSIGTREYSQRHNLGLLALDATTLRQVGSLYDGAENNCEPVSFSPLVGDTRVLAKTNRTGDIRPLLWDVKTGQRIDLELRELVGDVEPLTWSYDASHILLRHFYRAAQKLYIYDLTTHQYHQLNHPSGTFDMAYPTPQKTFVTLWMDSSHPVRPIALESEGQGSWQTVLPDEAPEIPCHTWRSVSFPSSDGEEIQGWLCMPKGSGPFPAMIEMHGGPDVVFTEMYSPVSQFWVDHGFAFLTVNYRGSTSFGKAFQEKIWGDAGHWEVEDIVAARAWLVAQGIARADQVFLTGWSYGGYLTLLALGKYPDLWAGGIACEAIADWAIAYEDTSPSLKSGRAARFGGTPQENPEVYTRSAPMTYAEQVKAPIFIVQGRHDTRTPPRSIEIYEAKMKALGKPIQVSWFDGGHYTLRGNLTRFMALQENFLAFTQHVLRGEEYTAI